MANSELRHQKFPVPHNILKGLNIALKKFSNETESKGYKRAHFILNQKYCTYEQLKRIKNYFDYIDPDNCNTIEYELNGGKSMHEWVNFILNQARSGIRKTKQIKNDVGFADQFGKENPTKPINPTIIDVPDMLFKNSELMLEINKIKNLMQKII